MILKASLSALISISVLFVVTRLLGKRQVSQLNFFDYINGITIGSIAAELSYTTGRERLVPLTALIVYGLVSYAISFLTNKSMLARRLFTGKPVILMENGKLYEKSLMRSHIDINEFLTQLRLQGFFDLNDVSLAVLEINGGLSILPKSGSRPATPDDLKIAVEPDLPAAAVIIDGHIMRKNLSNIEKNEDWLQNELGIRGARADRVLLATVDADGGLTLFMKSGDPTGRDIFS